jgi:hypothetical protein
VSVGVKPDFQGTAEFPLHAIDLPTCRKTQKVEILTESEINRSSPRTMRARGSAEFEF